MFLYDFYNFLKKVKKYKNPNSIFTNLVNSNLMDKIINSLAFQRSKDKNGKLDQEKFTENKEKIKNKILILGNLLKKYNDLEKFINAMVLGANEMSEGKGVNLLSVHASKGLEFKEVYIVDMMEGRFPNIKLSKPSGGIEEERRLFYVAVTRAKDRLYFAFAKRDKIKNIEYEPSRFLIEAGYDV